MAALAPPSAERPRRVPGVTLTVRKRPVDVIALDGEVDQAETNRSHLTQKACFRARKQRCVRRFQTSCRIRTVTWSAPRRNSYACSAGRSCAQTCVCRPAPRSALPARNRDLLLDCIHCGSVSEESDIHLQHGLGRRPMGAGYDVRRFKLNRRTLHVRLKLFSGVETTR